ncbi:MAG TPA: YibE/F family protein [Capillimicrobium sp.]
MSAHAATPAARRGGVYATPAGRALAIAVAALLAATLLGLVLLWPAGGEDGGRAPAGLLAETLPATVVSTDLVPCGPVDQECLRATAELDGGQRATLTLGPVGTRDVGAGDEIRLQRNPLPEGVEPGPGFEPYTFVDFDRRAPMLVLAIAFAVAAVLLARWRGALALLGIVLSVGLVVAFLVPAISDGASPVLASLVGALAVMFVTLGLTYGASPQAAAAALGIGLSLLLATLLGELLTSVAHLDGASSDLAGQLRADEPGLSLRGIVVASMVVGALGVLADTAVSQVSTVMALRRANPRQAPAQLYREAFVVGRDHLAATIHTLVLAYVGAALPLLLIIEASDAGLVAAITSQELAEPVVATLVGALALIVAVPLSTLLAAHLLHRVPVSALPEDGHAHAHAH